MPKTKDPEVLEFEAALLRSVGYCVRIERLEGLVAAHRHAH